MVFVVLQTCMLASCKAVNRSFSKTFKEFIWAKLFSQEESIKLTKITEQKSLFFFTLGGLNDITNVLMTES